MSDRIDHAAEARQHIEWAHEQQGVDGEFEFSVRDNALIAQAEATLALVEQQRIANVIALSAKQSLGNGAEVWISSFSQSGVLLPEIREALWIRE